MEERKETTAALTSEEKKTLLVSLSSWLNEAANLETAVTTETALQQLVIKGVLQAYKKDFNVAGSFTVVFPFALSYTANGSQVQNQASVLLRKVSRFFEAQNESVLSGSASFVRLETISWPYLFNVQKDGSETIQAVYQLIYRKESEFF